MQNKTEITTTEAIANMAIRAGRAERKAEIAREAAKEAKTTPQIYVACLASYNDGILSGEWIDATQNADEMMAEIMEMLSNSPIRNAEEWAIHDHQNFQGLKIKEDEDLKRIASLGSFIEQYGKIGAEVLKDYGPEIDSAINFMENNYIGEYDSEEKYAEELVYDGIFGDEFTKMLNKGTFSHHYIDWKHLTREMMMDLSTIEIDQKCHIFSNY